MIHGGDMNTLQVEMNDEIDKLIASLQLAKNLPGFRVKVNAVDRARTQVDGFVAFWDYKLDKIDEVEIGE